jgi:hypothetical protein
MLAAPEGALVVGVEAEEMPSEFSSLAASSFCFWVKT